jgi:uncharacterized protein YjcR
MATQLQIDANRRNAQLSTGPKTQEGKAAVSRNALKHGFRSDIYKTMLQDESAEAYDELLADLIAEHQPQTLAEESYVERMALCLDKLAILENLQKDVMILQSKVGPGEEKTLSIYWNQQDRLERAFDRALTMLRKLQRERRAAEAEAEAEAAQATSQEQNPAPAPPPQPIKPAPAPVPVPTPGAAIPHAPIDSGAEPRVRVLSQVPEEIASRLDNLPNVA